jgi:hypothetical protein
LSFGFEELTVAGTPNLSTLPTLEEKGVQIVTLPEMREWF